MQTTIDPPIILLTGRPGVGKSTAIKKIVSRLEDKAGGFYTREVRVAGKRSGFEIVTLDGQTECLATKDPAITFTDEVPFGKYRVNLNGIDAVAVPAIYRAMEQGQVIVIDEIGPMEIISERFCQVVLEILDSEAVVVGTIAQKANVFADKVRSHPRVMVRSVTMANRMQVAEQIYTELTNI